MSGNAAGSSSDDSRAKGGVEQKMSNRMKQGDTSTITYNAGIRKDLEPGETFRDPLRPRIRNPLGFLRRMLGKDDAGGGAKEFRGSSPATRLAQYLKETGQVRADPNAPFKELLARDALAQSTGIPGKTWTTFMFGDRRRPLPPGSSREEEDIGILGTCPLSSSLAACEWRVIDASDVRKLAFPPKGRINIAFKS